MNSRFPKKVGRGRMPRYTQSNNSDNKNNFRSQDNYTMEKKRVLSDTTLYNIARFLMGNEVAIVTKNERVEGVFMGFDSVNIWLSKVFVYDVVLNDSFSLMKDMLDSKVMNIRDILMIKVLNVNGKTDSVLVDEEISQRKQLNKLLPSDDKNFVPYFDEYEGHLDEEEKEVNDDMGISMKGDQGCWYNPEVMMKVNEERFNIKSTFNDNMEEYTTQIDRTDPLLQEKYERAEKLAREMENDSTLRRVRPFEDDDGEQDEEIMFSAVVTSVPVSNKSDVTTSSTSTKLNPNAPEFRPRIKSETFDHQQMQQQLEDIPMPNMQIMSVESVQQQQMMPIESVQQQQQQQMSIENQQQMIQRIAALHISMTPHTVATQPCQGQRLLSTTPPQWTVPMHNNSPGQYMVQPYFHQGQLMSSMFQTRQIAPEGTQNSTPGLFYSLGPLQGSLQGQFFVQPDHSSSAMNDGQHHPHHMFGSSLDVVPTQIQRQPHLMPANIPILQAAASANQIQQLQQQNLPQAHHTYYTQSPHNHAMMTGGQQMNTGGHATFPQLIFNPQAQQQLQSGTANIQGYLPSSNNGRP